jgi:hypothetical protein
VAAASEAVAASEEAVALVAVEHSVVEDE